MDTEKTVRLRWRIVCPLFEMLYRSRTLYWLASTVPFAGQWRVWQRLVVPRLVGCDVLEVGCGTGTLLADLVESGYTCRAVDRSPQMVAAARRELRRRVPAFDTAHIQQARVQRLPFAGASFDSVVSTFPTDYIYDPAALSDIARVLRPGGRLVIVLGARLLPAHAALLPLVALQRVVYGRSAGTAQPDARSLSVEPPSVSSGGDQLRLRLAEAGLAPRTEVVQGPFWTALLICGGKSDGEI